MQSDKKSLFKFGSNVFIYAVLMVFCVGVGISSASRKDDMIAECQQKLESTRNSNSLLIETNARLTNQLDAGKLDQLATGTDLKDRLSECEFRTRELEDEIMGKQKQITELEIEMADYSIEIRSMIEERHISTEKHQFARAEDDLVRFEMDTLADEFAVEFENEITKGLLAFEVTDEAVKVMLRNSLLFKPGTVYPTKRAMGVLRRVGGSLKSLEDINQWEITVAGHTDSIAPGKSLRKKYPTNWEMSQARAASVVHYFVDKESFPPASLGAIGYGQFRPVASNDTREGRGQNLRIEIIIAPVPKAPLKEEVPQKVETEPTDTDTDAEVISETISIDKEGN